MGNNSFLIPANSKKSMLIAGMFNKTDLLIFSTGVIITLILLFTIDRSTFTQVIITLTPLLISSFLVIPLPNEHNVRTFIKNIYDYYTKPREYHWKGWCVSYGKDKLQ